MPDSHDPLCHAYGFGPGQRMDICICTGIRIGRAAEQERMEQVRAQVERWRDIEQKETGYDPDNYFQTRAGGFVSACNAVLKLIKESGSDE